MVSRIVPMEIDNIYESESENRIVTIQPSQNVDVVCLFIHALGERTLNIKVDKKIRPGTEGFSFDFSEIAPHVNTENGYQILGLRWTDEGPQIILKEIGNASELEDIENFSLSSTYLPSIGR